MKSKFSKLVVVLIIAVTGYFLSSGYLSGDSSASSFFELTRDAPFDVEDFAQYSSNYASRYLNVDNPQHRIVVIGDSYCQGPLLYRRDGFSYSLTQMIRKTRTDTEVIEVCPFDLTTEKLAPVIFNYVKKDPEVKTYVLLLAGYVDPFESILPETKAALQRAYITDAQVIKWSDLGSVFGYLKNKFQHKNYSWQSERRYTNFQIATQLEKIVMDVFKNLVDKKPLEREKILTKLVSIPNLADPSIHAFEKFFNESKNKTDFEIYEMLLKNFFDYNVQTPRNGSFEQVLFATAENFPAMYNSSLFLVRLTYEYFRSMRAVSQKMRFLTTLEKSFNKGIVFSASMQHLFDLQKNFQLKIKALRVNRKTNFEKAFEQIKALGATPVVLTYPIEQSFVANRELRELAEENKIYIIDLANELKSSGLNSRAFTVNFHPSPELHKEIAKIIYRSFAFLQR